MQSKGIAKTRPAETKTGALGGVALVLVSMLEAFGISVTGAWLKTIAGTLALAPALFTWLTVNGGIRGVVGRVLQGDAQEPAETQEPAKPAARAAA